jgi:hypothetical protein
MRADSPKLGRLVDVAAVWMVPMAVARFLVTAMRSN